MPWKCKRAISFQEYRIACKGYPATKAVCPFGPNESSNGKCDAIHCRGWQSLKRIPTRKKVKDVKAV